MNIDFLQISAYCGAVMSIVTLIMFLYKPIKNIQKNNEKKYEIINNALKVILKGSIVHITESVLNRGVITTNEISIINAQNEVYQQLEEDRTTARLVNVAINLPIVQGKGDKK